MNKDFRFAIAVLASGLGGAGFWVMACAVLLVIAISYLMTQPALIIGSIVSSYQAGTIGQEAMTALAILAGVLVLKEILTLGQKLLVEKTSVDIQALQFAKLVDVLFGIEVTALQGRRSAEVTARIDRSVAGLARLLKLAFMDLVPSLLAAAFAIWFAFQAHWLAGLTMLGVIVINTAVTAYQLISQKGIRVDLQDRRIDLAGRVGEVIGSLGFVRAAWLGPSMSMRLAEEARAVSATEMRHHRAMMAFDFIKQIAEGLGLISVVIIGMTMAGGAGEAMALVLLFARVTQPVQILHRVVDEGQEAVIAIAGVRDITELGRDPSLGGTTPPAFDSPTALELTDLKFAFSDADGKPSSPGQNVDLVVPKGQYVGIVGPTGCGKSTLLKVSMGLLNNFEGTAEVMGVSVRELDKEQLAKRVCYLPQEPFLIAGTLRENLLVGGSAHTEQAMHNALVAAMLPAEQWREGLEVHIDEGGRNLSGGQRQRISLARAFLSQADIFILDEATSQLDTVTERGIVSALKRHWSGKTIFAIAHRLPSIEDADRIIVMEEGRIVQDGPSATLSQVEGLYRRLLKASEANLDHDFA